MSSSNCISNTFITMHCDVIIGNDVLVRCYTKSRKLLFQVVFHTGFIVESTMHLPKSELDEVDKQ